MLSDHEQKVWDDIERLWGEDAEEPAPAGRAVDLLRRPTPRRLDNAPRAVLAGIWAAIFLVLFDAHGAGLAVAAAAALGLALWRYWPMLSSRTAALTGAPAAPDRGPRRPVERARHGRLWRWLADG